MSGGNTNSQQPAVRARPAFDRHNLDPIAAQVRLNSIRDVRKKLHEQPNILTFYRAMKTDPYLSKVREV